MKARLDLKVFIIKNNTLFTSMSEIIKNHNLYIFVCSQQFGAKILGVLHKEMVLLLYRTLSTTLELHWCLNAMKVLYSKGGVR